MASGLSPSKVGSTFRAIHPTSFGLVKGEKVKNPITGDYEDSDESLMHHVETLLGVVQPSDHRNRILSMIGGFRIEHPNDLISVAHVFPEVFASCKTARLPNEKRSSKPALRRCKYCSKARSHSCRRNPSARRRSPPMLFNWQRLLQGVFGGGFGARAA